MKFRVVASSWITVLLWAVPAVSAQTKPAVPRASTNSPSPSPVGKPPESAIAAVDPNKYVLGSEDVLYIKTWREPDFTFPAVVRPDGKITVSLIGEVQAGGLTPQQLTTDLKQKLSQYLNNPDVTVFVAEVHSKKYFIDGEVNRPGSYPLVSPTTVLEALSNAAGFKDFANPKKVKILRGDKTFKFNYREVTSGKKQEQNIFLENGDHVIVP